VASFHISLTRYEQAESLLEQALGILRAAESTADFTAQIYAEKATICKLLGDRSVGSNSSRRCSTPPKPPSFQQVTAAPQQIPIPRNPVHTPKKLSRPPQPHPNKSLPPAPAQSAHRFRPSSALDLSRAIQHACQFGRMDRLQQVGQASACQVRRLDRRLSALIGGQIAFPPPPIGFVRYKR